ncbi:hypothetical protein [Sporosarcina sp. FA15]|uniref:hypothetical protein n=1 Tax=Sporosarcina sp. FA15 TaxID=3413031 RepID=UPI003F65F615
MEESKFELSVLILQESLAKYVELKNPIESTVALNKERVLIRGVDYRRLGALLMPLPRLR